MLGKVYLFKKDSKYFFPKKKRLGLPSLKKLNSVKVND
jgi:hypothetical protein